MEYLGWNPCSQTRAHMLAHYAAVSCTALWWGWPKRHRHTAFACIRSTRLLRTLRGILSEIPRWDNEHLQPPCAERLAASASLILLEMHLMLFLWDMFFFTFTIIQGGNSLKILPLLINKGRERRVDHLRLGRKSRKARVCLCSPRILTSS